MTGESVAINIAGVAGSVVPTGLITTANGSFNSVIRFYPTKATRQQHLFANGLRLAGASPHLVLKNTSSAPITASPKFTPSAGPAAGMPVTLPGIVLNPQQTIEIDLSPLITAARRLKALEMVSVEITNSGAPGSLIGAIYNSQTTQGVNYDVPLRDSGPLRNSAGNYPWRLDGDFTTVVSITNVGSQPASFLAAINYEGGAYLPKLQTLAVGESFVFDLNKIRNE